MKYKHIIFDIDGTMLDSVFADLTALERVLSEMEGKNYPIRDLYFALGIPGEIALRQLKVKDVSRANQLWGSYMKELTYTMKLFDGIKEVLEELREQGVKLGIITSKNRTEFKSDFTPFGLDTYFDTIITVEECIAPKPSGEPMLSYIRKTATNQHELLYVGDTIYDSQCANSAGVDFGLALWGCHSEEQLYATHYFDAPRDILHLIAK